MSQSKYVKEVKTGFAMLKLARPPSPFNDVHLTVSWDDRAKSALEEVWRLSHFTFVEVDFMFETVKTHVYIRLKDDGGEHDLLNLKGTAFFDGTNTFLPLCREMLRDGDVTRAIRNPERFVLDV